MRYTLDITYRQSYANGSTQGPMSKDEAMEAIGEALDTGLDLYAITLSPAGNPCTLERALVAKLGDTDILKAVEELQANNRLLRERLRDVLRVIRPEQLVDLE